jgi:glyoxylase-like metal-dependent hydrolase (beta-lactamase superfamily II)
MREVLPGIYHWTATHPNIGMEVSSFWLEDGGVLVDPLVPPGAGVAWFSERSSTPTAIALSNRHHYRHSAEFVDAYGVSVLVPRAGLHEFRDGREVTPYDPGERLPGGLHCFEIGGLCPDEMALHSRSGRALFLADGIVRATQEGGPLGFVPDSLMDDPPETKRALLEAYARALDELEFEHVLMAHGGAVIGDGRAQLQEFVDTGGRTAFEF